MLPLDLGTGKLGPYLVSLLIGVAFGVVLELAGFGNSTKLAAQFYFRDMTVLKVMFTGIVTAALLIFLSSALGFLDFSKIYVNQTFLWPGIVGGLVMGVGFVIGGYCPGTSAVSAASLKLDGMAFLGGTVVGAGLFGETVQSYSRFWSSSYTERILVSDWLGWSVGATVVGVTVMAIAMFYAAEKTEWALAHPGEKIPWRPTSRRHVAGAAVAIGTALFVWGAGEPTPDQKWARLAPQYAPLLERRDVYVHPLEYVKTWNDAAVKLVTVDLRSPESFEDFHLAGAKNVTYEGLGDKDLLFSLNQLRANGVVIIVSDDEEAAVRAWKRLKVSGVTNLYLLDRPMTDWKPFFEPVSGAKHFDFAKPPPAVIEAFPKDAFEPHIKLKTARRAGGLCG